MDVKCRLLWLLSTLAVRALESKSGRTFTCRKASGGKSMELRVSKDSILWCRDPLCIWDIESVRAVAASSFSINSLPPSPLPSPSSELESPSPDRRDSFSPDSLFWCLYDGPRLKLHQLDLRLVQSLPEPHGGWGEAQWYPVCSRNGKKYFDNFYSSFILLFVKNMAAGWTYLTKKTLDTMTAPIQAQTMSNGVPALVFFQLPLIFSLNIDQWFTNQWFVTVGQVSRNVSISTGSVAQDRITSNR